MKIDYYKIVLLLIGVLLTVWIIDEFINKKELINDDDIEELIEQEIELHDTRKKKSAIKNSTIKLENKIKNLKDEIIQNDTIYHDADLEQIDSIFTDYFRTKDMLQQDSGKFYTQ